jgi:hypothetical protein
MLNAWTRYPAAIFDEYFLNFLLNADFYALRSREKYSVDRVLS